jgi:hypothetical protein
MIDLSFYINSYLSPNNTKIKVTFPVEEHGCSYLTFELNNKTFNITAEMLKESHVNSFLGLAKFLNLPLIDGSYKLLFQQDDKHTRFFNIDASANHICFVFNGKEVAYWVQDELIESPEEILGACVSLFFEDA